ncbi:neuronal acetylcholine receptor subunit alpha-3-like isoform X2 [Montipora capricornis]|uniref:neuronal acetylcholine receptor subunit alpha-3-like isoform X2 n=1 Tax=Montipora capricornis TaxID=246305 RepID=UPI0035F1AC1C
MPVQRLRDVKSLLLPVSMLFFLLVSTAERNVTRNAYQRLLLRLFEEYNSDGHPGGGSSVKVWVGAKVVRIVNINEKNNAMQAQWWMTLDWNNPDLSWNPKDFDDLKTIHVEPSKVWVPDVLLYNNADKSMDAAGGLEKYKTKISISFDGNNSWMAPAMFQSICKIDIKYFPFDEQKCHMKFASWAYDVSKLDVCVHKEESGLVKGIYQPSNEWNLNSVDVVRNEVKYNCCPHPYSEVLVTLNLERRSRYYVINLVFPCALIACMVFFTFVLPPECGERVSLCITILMAMTIFQELTSTKLPPSSDTFFLIGTYYTVAIFEIGLAIAATCVVLNFYYSKTKMPGWMRTLFLKTMAPVLRVNIRSRHFSFKDNQLPKEVLHAHEVTHNPAFDSLNITDGGRGWGGITDVFEQSQSVTLTSVNASVKESLSYDHATEEEQEESPALKLNGVSLRGKVSTLAEKTTSKNTTKTLEKKEPTLQQMIEWQDEWRAASQVLDRIIIVFSVIIGFISAAAIFLQAPRVRQIFQIS